MEILTFSEIIKQDKYPYLYKVICVKFYIIQKELYQIEFNIQSDIAPSLNLSKLLRSLFFNCQLRIESYSLTP